MAIQLLPWLRRNRKRSFQVKPSSLNKRNDENPAGVSKRLGQWGSTSSKRDQSNRFLLHCKKEHIESYKPLIPHRGTWTPSTCSTRYTDRQLQQEFLEPQNRNPRKDKAIYPTLQPYRKRKGQGVVQIELSRTDSTYPNRGNLAYISLVAIKSEGEKGKMLRAILAKEKGAIIDSSSCFSSRLNGASCYIEMPYKPYTTE